MQADADADEILEWLIANDAGNNGVHWFLALEEAIAWPPSKKDNECLLRAGIKLNK